MFSFHRALALSLDRTMHHRTWCGTYTPQNRLFVHEPFPWQHIYCLLRRGECTLIALRAMMGDSAEETICACFRRTACESQTLSPNFAGDFLVFFMLWKICFLLCMGMRSSSIKIKDEDEFQAKKEMRRASEKARVKDQNHPSSCARFVVGLAARIDRTEAARMTQSQRKVNGS